MLLMNALSRNTCHEYRKAGGRTCRAIGLDGGRRMRSLPYLYRGAVRTQTSAYSFSLRAIQATADESRLPGPARSEVYRRSSTARRARNALSDESRSHWCLSRQWEQAHGARAGTGKAYLPQASRKTPHNSGSRILVEDLTPYRASFSSRLMLPHSA